MPDKSWGHQMLPLAEARVAGWRCAPECSSGKRCPQRWKKHYEHLGYVWEGGPTTHIATYRYVTGRAGRISSREVALCSLCAARWAAKHPSPEKVSEHA